MIHTFWRKLLFQTHGASDNFRDHVRVTVGAGSPVFQVSLPFFCNRARNSNTAATISNASGEIMNRACFMVSSKTPLIVLPPFGIVGFDMAKMMTRESINCFLNFNDSVLIIRLSSRCERRPPWPRTGHSLMMGVCLRDNPCALRLQILEYEYCSHG